MSTEVRTGPKPRRLRATPWLAAAALLAFPLSPWMPAYWLTLANFIGLGALVALGIVLLTGVGGMTSFGQAAFIGIGAYLTAYLTTAQAFNPWLTLLISIAGAAAAAWILAVATLGLSGHFLSVSTIAWGLAMYFLFGNIDALGRYDGIHEIPAPSILGWTLAGDRAFYVLIWAATLAALFGAHRLLRSRSGRALRALRAGGSMGQAFGIDMAHYRVVVFVIAAMLAGLSGWLYAHWTRGVNPTPFGINAGIEYMLMAVVGGSGSLLGALLGSGAVTILRDQLQTWSPALTGATGNFEGILFGVLLVVILQRAPDGLWPILERLWSGARPRSKTAAAGVDKPRQEGKCPEASASGARSSAALLEVDGIRKSFGGVVALKDLSLSVGAGEIVGLIGPNGAGKSTCFNVISGALALDAGSVSLAGKRIDGSSAQQIVGSGLARTFQHVELVPTMSVLDNVAIGTHLRGRSGVAAALLGLDRKEESLLLSRARENAHRVGLGDFIDHPAGGLPLGLQRLIEVARALCAEPKLLLLDEPAAGLRHAEKARLARLLREIADQGISVLLVEHDMDFVMDLAEKIVVMDFGSRIAQGRPEEILSSPVVLEAYLGGFEELA